MNPARLNTVRGPHGEIIVTQTYANWRYRVTMHTDGAIHVKHGDWLSKYSAAMYNDYWHINEFARRDASGKFVPIKNVNLVRAGETLYHVPTYNEFVKGSRPAAPGMTVLPMSEAEKKQIILEHLKGEFDLRGEHFEVLEKVADGIHIGSEAGEAGEAIASLIAHVPEAVEGALSAFSVFGVIAFDIVAAIHLLNAFEFGMRMIGLRAIAYGITAWSFGTPPPAPPGWIRTNVIAAGRQQEDVRERESAWNDSCKAAWTSMEEKPLKPIVLTHVNGPHQTIQLKREWLKAVFRAIGDGKPNELAKNLMHGIAGKYLRTQMEIAAFWSPQPNYPS